MMTRSETVPTRRVRPFAAVCYFLFAMVLAPPVLLAIHAGKFNSIKPWLRSNRHGAVSSETIRNVRLAVKRVSKILPGSTCLFQASMAKLLLNFLGGATVMKIGVYSEQDESVHAHAWLMSGRTIVIGGPAEKIKRFHQISEII